MNLKRGTIRRRVSLWTAATVIVCAALYAGKQPGSARGDSSQGYPDDCQKLTPNPTPPNPSCDILTNVATQAGYGEGGNVTAAGQEQFDTFSWQSFVALNCPATIPSDSSKPTDQYDNLPRVWETFVDAVDLFRPADGLLKAYQTRTRTQGKKVLRLMAKNEHFHGGGLEFLEATGFPLIDRNLNFVLYEIRLNPDEVAYIKKHHLENFKGQYSFLSGGGKVDFPAGPTSEYGSAGAIEVKAAWRILDPTKGDDATKFYTRRATVYIEAQFTENHQPLFIKDVLVGLVGLHIVHKTAKETEWIWSTFEQVENAPDQYGPYSLQSVNFSFFNAQCVADCQINTPPKVAKGDATYTWAAKPPYAGKYATVAHQGKYGTQVVRASAIYPETICRNVAWQQKINGTEWDVLKNYQLVGTQWSAFGFRFPKVLANTTLETYNQGSSSCMDCHKMATTAALQKPADFSFALGLARPIPTKLSVRR